MAFLWLKWIHVLSAVVLLGTGIGIAFFMFRANANREIGAIRFALKNAVLADMIFTLPAVLLVPVTGHFLMQTGSVSIKDPWVIFSLGLFFLAGLCWLPAVFLQRRMRDLAGEAVERGTELSPVYWKYERIWFWLGVIAFSAMVGIFFLMVFKPVLAKESMTVISDDIESFTPLTAPRSVISGWQSDSAARGQTLLALNNFQA